jgi:hypothetical protein
MNTAKAGTREKTAPMAAIASNVLTRLTEFTRLAPDGRELSERDALNAVTRTAVTAVPGVEYASISMGRNGNFWTVAATDGAARLADAIQYELGSGPCVDAALDGTIYRTGDLPTDPRWPVFGPSVFEETGARSLLAFRLFIEINVDVVAALNLYSNAREAFDTSSETIGLLLATHGARAVSAAIAREKQLNVHETWMSNNKIDAAVRIVAQSHGLTTVQAFDLLLIVSQYGNRKLADIAADVNDTGNLSLPPYFGSAAASG